MSQTNSQHCLACGLPKPRSGKRDDKTTCSNFCSDVILTRLIEAVDKDDLLRLLAPGHIALPRPRPGTIPIDGLARIKLFMEWKSWPELSRSFDTTPHNWNPYVTYEAGPWKCMCCNKQRVCIAREFVNRVGPRKGTALYLCKKTCVPMAESHR